MRGHGSKLLIKKDEALVSLLSSSSIEQAAIKVGISPSTMFRWMHNDEFRADYREAKAAYVYQAITLLQQATTEAVVTLRSIMLDETKPVSTRAFCAKTVLETTLKTVELENLMARVEQLEKAFNYSTGVK